MKKSILLNYLLWACCCVVPLAEAGDRLGNGGDLLECFNGHKYEYMMLDLYQAKHQLKLNVDLEAGVTALEKVEKVLERLSRVNYQRFALYKKYLADYRVNTEFVRGQQLVDIPDTGTQVIPRHCKLLQVAVQRAGNELMVGDFRYVVNDDLWQLMDEENKAALILHEIIYREYIEHGVLAHSAFVRRFNAYVISKEIETVDLLKLSIALFLPTAELRGPFLYYLKYQYSPHERKVVPTEISMGIANGNVDYRVSTSLVGLLEIPDWRCVSMENFPWEANQPRSVRLRDCGEGSAVFLIFRGYRRSDEKPAYVRVDKSRTMDFLRNPGASMPGQNLYILYGVLAEDFVYEGTLLCGKGSVFMVGPKNLSWQCNGVVVREGP